MSSNAAAIENAERPTRQRHLMAVILLVVLFVSYIDRVNVSILVADPAFLTDMGITGQAVQKGLLMTVFLFAYGIGNIVLSPIGDLLGARKAMSLAIVCWAGSLIVGGLAAAITTMLVSRALLGLSEGLHFPMQNRYVKEWFPRSERGKANAVWNAGVSLAPAVAMPMIASIVAFSGWRSSFYMLCALCLIPLLLVWFFTADTPRKHPKVNALELEHIESGLTGEAENSGLPETEKKRSFVRDYQFWLLTAYYALHNSIFWGYLTWLPTYLKEARGFSWSAMGMLSSLPFMVSLAGKLFAGYLCDKTGRRAPLILFSMGTAVVGMYLGATLTDNVVAAVVFGVGAGMLGFALPPAWTMLQDIVPTRAAGAGAGLMNGIAQIFSALSPAIMGLVIDMTGSYAYGLFYLVATGVLAAIVMLILMLKGR